MEITIRKIRKNSSMAYGNEVISTVSRFYDDETKFETLKKQIVSSKQIVNIKFVFGKN